MNKLVITGRVTKDAELGFIPTVGTPKLTFTVAVDRSYQKDKQNKKTDFVPCVMFGKRAETLSNYIQKGQLVAIEGELHIENVKKGDEWKTFVTLQVNEFEFLGGQNKKEENKMELVEQFLTGEDDLPF